MHDRSCASGKSMMENSFCLATVGFVVTALAACSASTTPDPGRDVGGDEKPRASAAPVIPGFCARSGADAVRDAFCAEPRAVRSLHDLQLLVDADPSPAQSETTPSDPKSKRFPVALGHSTALSGHMVSTINPRLFVIGGDTITAFQRGVQHVELASITPDRKSYNFYLLRFKQHCNASADGCGHADLFTSNVENDWTDYEVLDEEDLKNTPLDCAQCHRRARETGILLMRELNSPWTHFFERPLEYDTGHAVPGIRGDDLLADFKHAHGEETYGNAELHDMPRSTSLLLQTVVGQYQPLLFDSHAIEQERWPYGPDGYADEPQASPTWSAAFEAFKRGEQLAIPYFEPRVSDPDKLAQLTAAINRYRDGELSEEDFPDLADVFPDDPWVRAQIGLQTVPDATPAEALIQACGSCHNDALDQSISRARFNIDVSRLTPAQLGHAIERIQRKPSAAGAMPPPMFRALAPDTRKQLVDYLKAQMREQTPEPMLEQAAKLGMMGGSVMVRGAY